MGAPSSKYPDCKLCRTDRQDGDDLFIRSADARQTSSLLLTPNIQPKLYDVHTQSPANSWSLPFNHHQFPGGWCWKRIIHISGQYSSQDNMGDTRSSVPVLPRLGLGLATIGRWADIINGGPGAWACTGVAWLIYGDHATSQQRHKSNIFKTNEILTYFAGINWVFNLCIHSTYHNGWSMP